MRNLKQVLRPLLFGMSLLLVLSCLVGCGYRPTEPDAQDIKPVGTVENYTVYYEELYYLTMTVKDAMIKEYGEGIFDASQSADRHFYESELRRRVYENLTSSYAVLKLARDKTGYTAAEAAEYAEERVAELYKNAGSAHAYRKLLHESYMTDHFVRFQYTVNELRNTLLYHCVYSLGEIESDPSAICEIILDSGTYVRTRHIAIFKDNGKSDAVNRETAEKILSELKGNRDFSALLEQYNEDTAQTSDGYYFMAGEMQEAYEEAAFALQIGETSGVVETDQGYFILTRLPLDEAYVYMNCYGAGAPLYESYQNYTFLAFLDEEQEKLTFVPNEYAKSLDLSQLPVKEFRDPLYVLELGLYGLMGAGVIALIVWWCVASAKADRKTAKKQRKTR